MTPLPKNCDLNTTLRPEIALFALALEFRTRLHDEVYHDSWTEETRESVREGVQRNLADFFRAVEDDDVREMANESADVGNWIRFIPCRDPRVLAEFRAMAEAVCDPSFEYKHG